ncbi:DUF4419 domain-containing protein [Hymenobacter ruricola]|uniref:DUF4419 domain-containing protein n=1 Tax=Hymenobacter ruricola TaxID=2791023 RepID=A0ABS0I1U6_9BACT|nr:DUF4419 domain-containing protein [Hymenobacter ruricola]MBF9220909.1 DUF4419 domain-containing protein [Hymenobacter ruricola]
MKTAFALCLLLLASLAGRAQPGVTFEIETLPKPKNHVFQLSAQQVVGAWRADVEKTSPLPDSLAYFGDNPVLTGFLTAYKEHRPVVLSPDMVWLLISQGFARHVATNAALLQHELVGFEGKKKLIVAVTDIQVGNPASHWEQVFPQFNAQIADYAGPDLTAALTCDFSTTTPVTRVASQITVMEAVKSYFEYEVIILGCGIPRVTLEGTPEDWEKVLRKTQYLSRYQLGWWTSELEPILREFISTAKGHGRKQFWMNMVKAHTEKKYGSPTTIDGWIVKFYPFTNKGQRTQFKPIKHIGTLAPELVKVPFILKDEPARKTYKMEFWAGFVGLRQDRASYALRPEIAWAVVNKEHFNASHSEFRNTTEIEDLSISHVSVVPEDIYALKRIDKLHLNFLKDIVVPDELTRISIGTLWLTGTIAPAEAQRLVARFPNTTVYINGAPR